MSFYRRLYVSGGTYFFTVVTADRAPIFADCRAVACLGRAMRKVRAKHPFETIASVILPDHLHCLWTLPRGDSDFPRRWQWIKAEFTEQWIADGGGETARSKSQTDRGERGVWQRRFWEHFIRDEDDSERHFDYIHFNPVKHGLVQHPAEWPNSTFARHVRLGAYPAEWGKVEPRPPSRLTHPTGDDRRRQELP